MKPASITLLGLAALPFAVVAYHWGRSPGAASAMPRIVTITARDYSLDAPDTLPEGAVTLRLLNQGNEFHHLWLARLEGGKTPEDLLAALKTRAPLAGWVQEVGGPNAPMPGGGESNATVVLTPGNYVMACMIPSGDGVPHLMKGMIQPLTVVRAASRAKLPDADVQLTLRDYSFTLSQRLTPGRHRIEVRNAANQSHEIELVKLLPGKSTQDLLSWLERMQGAPVGIAVGGVSPLAPSGQSMFTVDLSPGKYVLLCFLPDASDHKSHLSHGMVQEIEVGEQDGNKK
jgi:hypothetical protein